AIRTSVGYSRLNACPCGGVVAQHLHREDRFWPPLTDRWIPETGITGVLSFERDQRPDQCSQAGWSGGCKKGAMNSPFGFTSSHSQNGDMKQDDCESLSLGRAAFVKPLLQRRLQDLQQIDAPCR